MSDKTIIATRWQELERRADCSIFLSWQWIGNWLDLVTAPIYLVESYQDGNIVGLGFFVEKTRKAFGLYPVKQWWLHRTGHQQQDQIWIEYNDFLLAVENKDTVRQQMVMAVSEYMAAGDEVIIGLSEQKVLNAFSGGFTDNRDLILSKGFLVDFNLVNNDYFTDVLSKNYRYQIKRSEKLLKKQGRLDFRVVTDSKAIEALLPEIAQLHIKRWQNTEEGSGFNNCVFLAFHKKLIGNNLNDNVQVAVLTLNDENIGYLINFVYKGTVSFYLSALSDNFDTKIKLGLLLHSKAILYYLSRKMKKYDLLAGEAQYKRSLSNKTYTLDIKCFLPSFIFKTKTMLIKYASPKFM